MWQRLVLINMPGQGNFGPRLARGASLVGVRFSKTDVRIEACTGSLQSSVKNCLCRNQFTARASSADVSICSILLSFFAEICVGILASGCEYAARIQQTG